MVVSLQYTKGSTVRVKNLFYNFAGVLSDPTTVTFKITAPDGTITIYVYLTDAELVKEAVGTYYVDINLSQEGLWEYRWESTGDPTVAVEGPLFVLSTRY